MKLLTISLASRTLTCISNFLPPSCLWFKNFSWFYEQQMRHNQKRYHL